MADRYAISLFWSPEVVNRLPWKDRIEYIEKLSDITEKEIARQNASEIKERHRVKPF